MVISLDVCCERETTEPALQPKNRSLFGYLPDIGSLQAGSTNGGHCSFPSLNCTDAAELRILNDEKETYQKENEKS